MLKIITKICRKFEALQSTPRLSIWRTIYFNLRTLPIKQAIRLPLLIYGKIKFASLDGSVKLPVSNTRLKIGVNYAGYRNTAPGRIHLLRGSLLILYPNVKISQGVNITCQTDAILEMKEYASLGDNVDVICYKHIELGHHSSLTWGCQVMDYNSHYVIDMSSTLKYGTVKRIANQVIIGCFCWIGNRSTVMPGTRLPNRTIVASNSLLNKDYTRIVPPYSLIAGQPAKLVKEWVKRIYDLKTEQFLTTHFKTTEDQVVYLSDKIEID